MSPILPLLISFLICLILVPLTIRFARRFGLVDNPKTRKHPASLHTKTLPRAGGLPIYIAFVASALVFLQPTQKILGIILGGLILVVIGLLDDRYDLKSRYKLLTQICAALLVVGSGIGISFIPNPIAALLAQGYEVIRLDTLRITFEFFGPHSILVLADLFALFWIVWVINMVNFSSGVDGQLPLIVFVALMVIFASTLNFNDPNEIIVSILALIGAGATLGFLVFNFFPAKIFPGDSGSYFLGFLIAVLAILSEAKVGTALLAMAVPLIDGVFIISRRILAGKSPFTGDREHLQHRLMRLGWGQRRIALFYFLVCAILGILALGLHSIEKLFALLVVIIVIVGVLLWLSMNLSPRRQNHSR